MIKCVLQYDYDDLVMNYIYCLTFSCLTLLHYFTVVVADDNDLTGPIPEEICNLLPLSEKFTYDTDKVKGCPINVHSGASNEFSTYSLILFTCCVPLLVWELL